MKRRAFSIMMFIVLFVSSALSPQVVKAATENSFDNVYVKIESKVIEEPFSRSTEIHTQYQKVNLLANDNSILASYTLTGRFEVVPGVSVRCTSALITNIKQTTYWKVEDYKASYNNSNSALSRIYGEATFKKRILGIPVSSKPSSVSFTCDKYGN